MVSKKLIKSYDFDTIEDYFNYIIDSKINGQRAQAKELYDALSTRQKNAFNQWFRVAHYYDAIDTESTSELEYANLLTYLNG